MNKDRIALLFIFILLVGGVVFSQVSPSPYLNGYGRFSILNYTRVEGVNLSASNMLSGNMSWSNLSGFPTACPSGSFVSTIDDSTTCTTAGAANINMNGNNITNVSYIFLANSTSATAWKIYVNSSNSLVIESN